MKTRLLFNPFERIAGLPSLTIGMLGMLVAGYLGYLSKTNFDGLLNAHAGKQLAWYVHLLGPALSIATISVWFAVFALIFSKSKVRMVDIIGTQCFAFLPMVPVGAMGFFKVVEEFGNQMQQVVQNPGQQLHISPSLLIGFLVVTVLVLLFVIWSAVWIYNGYKVASNLPNKFLIPVYISGLIFGMIIPKYILNLIIIE
jgi:hypothetical protein